MGPGAWPGAKGVIEETYKNNMFPDVHKRSPSPKDTFQIAKKLLQFVFTFVTVATLNELSQDLKGEWQTLVGWFRTR